MVTMFQFSHLSLYLTAFKNPEHGYISYLLQTTGNLNFNIPRQFSLL